MKKPLLIILCSFVGLAWLAFTVLTFYACSIKKFDNNINHYLKNGDCVKDYAGYVLPDLNDLPEYQDILYQFYSTSHLTLGVAETMLLVVKYDEYTYESEKAKLDDDYVFLDYTAQKRMPANEFSINNYDFRVVNTELNDGYEYPGCFGMIATSDENCSIAYLFFKDLELDYIGKNGADSMKEFVQGCFRYEW